MVGQAMEGQAMEGQAMGVPSVHREGVSAATGPLVLCAVVEDVTDQSDLKHAAGALVEELSERQVEAAAVAVVGRISERVFLQAATFGPSPSDANLALKSVLSDLGGKGGGSKTAAQGSCSWQAGWSLSTISDALRDAFLNQTIGATKS